jgi:hypothetical protein
MRSCRTSTASCAAGRPTSAIGNSARQFDKVTHYAQDRIARFVAKRHKRNWGYGLMVVVYQSPDRLGLIDLQGTIVAPRPNRPWRPGR